MSAKDELRLLLKKAFSSESDFERNSVYLLEKAALPSQSNAKEIIDFLKSLIKDKKESSKMKFLALKFLKDAMELKNEVFVNYLAVKMLKRFGKLAEYNRRVKDENRGRTLFGSNADQESSQNFFILLLDSIRTWQEMYPIDNATKSESKFKKLYKQLLKKEVKFPENRGQESEKNQDQTQFSEFMGQLESILWKIIDFLNKTDFFDCQSYIAGEIGRIQELAQALQIHVNTLNDSTSDRAVEDLIFANFVLSNFFITEISDFSDQLINIYKSRHYPLLSEADLKGQALSQNVITYPYSTGNIGGEFMQREAPSSSSNISASLGNSARDAYGADMISRQFYTNELKDLGLAGFEKNKEEEEKEKRGGDIFADFGQKPEVKKRGSEDYKDFLGVGNNPIGNNMSSPDDFWATMDAPSNNVKINMENKNKTASPDDFWGSMDSNNEKANIENPKNTTQNPNDFDFWVNQDPQPQLNPPFQPQIEPNPLMNPIQSNPFQDMNTFMGSSNLEPAKPDEKQQERGINLDDFGDYEEGKSEQSNQSLMFMEQRPGETIAKKDPLNDFWNPSIKNEIPKIVNNPPISNQANLLDDFWGQEDKISLKPQNIDDFWSQDIKSKELPQNPEFSTGNNLINSNFDQKKIEIDSKFQQKPEKEEEKKVNVITEDLFDQFENFEEKSEHNASLNQSMENSTEFYHNNYMPQTQAQNDNAKATENNSQVQNQINPSNNQGNALSFWENMNIIEKFSKNNENNQPSKNEAINILEASVRTPTSMDRKRSSFEDIEEWHASQTDLKMRKSFNLMKELVEDGGKGGPIIQPFVSDGQKLDFAKKKEQTPINFTEERKDLAAADFDLLSPGVGIPTKQDSEPKNDWFSGFEPVNRIEKNEVWNETIQNKPDLNEFANLFDNKKMGSNQNLTEQRKGDLNENWNKNSQSQHEFPEQIEGNLGEGWNSNLDQNNNFFPTNQGFKNEQKGQEKPIENDWISGFEPQNPGKKESQIDFFAGLESPIHPENPSQLIENKSLNNPFKPGFLDADSFKENLQENSPEADPFHNPSKLQINPINQSPIPEHQKNYQNEFINPEFQLSNYQSENPFSNQGFQSNEIPSLTAENQAFNPSFPAFDSGFTYSQSLNPSNQSLNQEFKANDPFIQSSNLEKPNTIQNLKTDDEFDLLFNSGQSIEPIQNKATLFTPNHNDPIIEQPISESLDHSGEISEKSLPNPYVLDSKSIDKANNLIIFLDNNASDDRKDLDTKNELFYDFPSQPMDEGPEKDMFHDFKKVDFFEEPAKQPVEEKKAPIKIVNSLRRNEFAIREELGPIPEESEEHDVSLRNEEKELRGSEIRVQSGVSEKILQNEARLEMLVRELESIKKENETIKESSMQERAELKAMISHESPKKLENLENEIKEIQRVYSELRRNQDEIKNELKKSLTFPVSAPPDPNLKFLESNLQSISEKISLKDSQSERNFEKLASELNYLQSRQQELESGYKLSQSHFEQVFLSSKEIIAKLENNKDLDVFLGSVIKTFSETSHTYQLMREEFASALRDFQREIESVKTAQTSLPPTRFSEVQEISRNKLENIESTVLDFKSQLKSLKDFYEVLHKDMSKITSFISSAEESRPKRDLELLAERGDKNGSEIPQNSVKSPAKRSLGTSNSVFNIVISPASNEKPEKEQMRNINEEPISIFNNSNLQIKKTINNPKTEEPTKEKAPLNMSPSFTKTPKISYSDFKEKQLKIDEKHNIFVSPLKTNPLDSIAKFVDEFGQNDFDERERILRNTYKNDRSFKKVWQDPYELLREFEGRNNRPIYNFNGEVKIAINSQNNSSLNFGDYRKVYADQRTKSKEKNPNFYLSRSKYTRKICYVSKKLLSKLIRGMNTARDIFSTDVKNFKKACLSPSAILFENREIQISQKMMTIPLPFILFKFVEFPFAAQKDFRLEWKRNKPALLSSEPLRLNIGLIRNYEDLMAIFPNAQFLNKDPNEKITKWGVFLMVFGRIEFLLRLVFFEKYVVIIQISGEEFKSELTQRIKEEILANIEFVLCE